MTGTASCPTVDPGTTTTVDGVEQVRGRVAECTYTSSDPGVGEPTTNNVNLDCFELTPAMVAAAKAGAAVSIGMDHDNYRHAIDPLPQAARDALVLDLA